MKAAKPKLAFLLKRVKLLLFLSFFLTTSCATKGVVRLDEKNMPIKVIQNVIVKNLPQGKRKTFKGGREFHSAYVQPEGLPQFWPKAKKTDSKRSFATISILGDRRPYVIEVVVIDQVKVVNSRGKFRDKGLNQKAAEQLANRIEDELTKSLKDRNFIDDFRVF